MEFALFLVYFDLPPPTALARAIESAGLQDSSGGGGGSQDKSVTESEALARLAGCLNAAVPVAATLKLAKAWMQR